MSSIVTVTVQSLSFVNTTLNTVAPSVSVARYAFLIVITPSALNDQLAPLFFTTSVAPINNLDTVAPVPLVAVIATSV